MLKTVKYGTAKNRKLSTWSLEKIALSVLFNKKKKEQMPFLAILVPASSSALAVLPTWLNTM